MTTDAILAIAGIALLVYGILGRKINGLELKDFKLPTEPLDLWQRFTLATFGFAFLAISILPILGIKVPTATATPTTVTTELSTEPAVSTSTLSPTATPIPIDTPTFVPNPTSTAANRAIPTCVLEDFESNRQMKWWSPDSNVFVYNETSEQAHGGNQSLRVEYSKSDTYQFLAAEMQPGLCDFSKTHTLQVWVYGQINLLLKLEDQDGKQVDISTQSSTESTSWTLLNFNYASVSNVINLGNIKNIFLFPEPGNRSANAVFFLDDITLYPYSVSFIPAGEFTMGINE